MQKKGGSPVRSDEINMIRAGNPSSTTCIVLKKNAQDGYFGGSVSPSFSCSATTWHHAHNAWEHPMLPITNSSQNLANGIRNHQTRALLKVLGRKYTTCRFSDGGFMVKAQPMG